MAADPDDQTRRDMPADTEPNPMRYACLVYFDQDGLFEHAADVEVCVREGQAFNADLAARGHLVLSHALAPTADAMQVRVREGKTVVMDGPFAETKEVLGGIVLVDARDLNGALKIAAEIPLARKGTIEVRPVLDWPAGP